jgi:hypothetical protein
MSSAHARWSVRDRYRLVTIVPSRHEDRYDGGHVIYTDTGPLGERAMIRRAALGVGP